MLVGEFDADVNISFIKDQGATGNFEVVITNTNELIPRNVTAAVADANPLLRTRLLSTKFRRSSTRNRKKRSHAVQRNKKMETNDMTLRRRETILCLSLADDLCGS